MNRGIQVKEDCNNSDSAGLVSETRDAPEPYLPFFCCCPPKAPSRQQRNFYPASLTPHKLGGTNINTCDRSYAVGYIASHRPQATNAWNPDSALRSH